MTNTRMMIWLAVASYCWLVATVLIGGASTQTIVIYLSL